MSYPDDYHFCDECLVGEGEFCISLYGSVELSEPHEGRASSQ